MIAPPDRVDSQAGREWAPVILDAYSFASFPDRALVLDIGCGDGTQLQQLAAAGCVAIGVDVAAASLLDCRKRRLRVVQARAEELPIRTGALDGIVCKVVLPYTSESQTIREVARVLKPGGKALLSSHGAGYYLRYMFFAVSVKRVFYSVRTFLNTWLYALARRRVPGFLGDTLYQSRRRLHRYYRESNLLLIDDCPAPRYLGFPVFLYHIASKGRPDGA